MSNRLREKRLQEAKASTIGKFGHQSAIIGNERRILNVVPSPSLMLDYKLGIGGMPYGNMVEVFGPNGLGKTSAIGYGVLANVQREDKLPAIIAMEPNFDQDWAHKIHGLDPDLLLVVRPDNAEEAFDMLHDLVYGGLVDYILLDSIGAMAAESETREDSKKKAYGVSGVVTSGLNAIMPRLYKNNQGLMIINQQRQAGQSKNGVIFHESPGGEALKHHAQIRIQLKHGKEKYKLKIDGDDVVVGRDLTCVFRKNQMAQAADKKAEFRFFNIETEEYGIGIDKTGDILAVGKVTGVIEAAGGGYLRHASFPGGKLKGQKALGEFIEQTPEAYVTIRSEVMTKMLEREKIEEAKAVESEQVDD